MGGKLRSSAKYNQEWGGGEGVQSGGQDKNQEGEVNNQGVKNKSQAVHRE
jgi:hypothetical protein